MSIDDARDPHKGTDPTPDPSVLNVAEGTDTELVGEDDPAKVQKLTHTDHDGNPADGTE